MPEGFEQVDIGELGERALARESFIFVSSVLVDQGLHGAVAFSKQAQRFLGVGASQLHHPHRRHLDQLDQQRRHAGDDLIFGADEARHRLVLKSPPTKVDLLLPRRPFDPGEG